MDGVSRRAALKMTAGAICSGGAVWAEPAKADAGKREDALDVWQRETDLVTPGDYGKYMRGFTALEKLERAFERMFNEVGETKVEDVPAVWNIYNMGYVVKTRESLFSIDLVHRRAVELAPRLDFALITHNHGDHWRQDFYGAMNSAGKTVVSNFLDNYGAADWKKGGSDWAARGGYTRAEKGFKIRDVEIRTSLVDHNGYLIDFTTAFEMRVGNWLLYHSGDCGNAAKLGTVWGRPDLWMFFPGCGVDVADAMRRVNPKRVVFGHLWELGHGKGRLTTPMVRRAKAKAEAAGFRNVEAALWGDRVQ